MLLATFLVGAAVASSFSSGAGSLLANTSYVTLGVGQGAACPVPAGWNQFPLGAPSTGFAAGGMAYDYHDGYMVYYGGYTGSGSTYVPQTWEYAGGCWKDLGILNPSPSYNVGRSEFGMVWDGTDNQVLLFGGADTGSGAADNCDASNSYYYFMCGDTWGFSGGAWTVICNNGDGAGTGGSACSPTPPPMNAPQMAYDPVQSDCIVGFVTAAAVNASGCVFLYGGVVCSHACNSQWEDDNDSSQFWEFSNDHWHNTGLCSASFPCAAASRPSSRDFGTMTYDTAAGYLLLYGGENTTCASQNGHCTHTTGSCIADTTMSNYCDSAWSYVGGAWTQQCENVADSAGNKVGACYPPGKYGTEMTYDNYRNFVMDYGGFNGWVSHNDSDAHGYVYGAWYWNGTLGKNYGNWLPLTANGGASPISRWAMALSYDPGTQDAYVIVLGGANYAGYTSTMYIYK